MESIEAIKARKIPKGKILIKYGDICTYVYRVEKGCLKSYVIDKTGKEHILQFAPEGWLITDMDSVTNQKPSSIFIEAIEDSEILPIPGSDFKDLSLMDDGQLVEMAVKLRNNLIATNKRIISLLSATATQRYIEFTEAYPMLVQRLPLKLIASYIGITPEYLSDLRRKIAKK